MALDFTQGAFAPRTFDADARTVEAIVLTDTPVPRRDARGPYFEVLDPATVELPQGRIPLIDTHRLGSTRDVLGWAEGFRRESGGITCTLRFSEAGDVEPIFQRIGDGTLTGVSIGYRAHGWNEQTVTDGNRRRIRKAKRVTLLEVSLTINPADPNARLRSELEARMDPETENQMAAPPETVDAERTRRAEIRSLARSAGLSAEWADGQIDGDASAEAAKVVAFDAMRARSTAAPTIRPTLPQNDDPNVIRSRQAEALAFRMTGGELPEQARPYAHMRMVDVANEAVQRAGQSTRGMSPDEILYRAHSTSDFPLVVMDAAGKVAMASYEAAATPLKALGRQVTLPDFKENTAIRLGEMGRLEPIAEDGEITHTSRAETGEHMRLRTYARALNVTRELIINDDLSMLGDMTAAFGQSAAQTEADILVNLITDNPELSDGVAVFHKNDRGNVTEGGSLSTEADMAALMDGSLWAGVRKVMRRQVGLDGKTIINAMPRYLLVSPDLEHDAEKLLAQIQPHKTADVNPLGGKLELLVEPRLPGYTHYLFADPARLAALRFGYLAGAQGVQVQRAEAWDTLGLKFRAFLDFGAGWLDWRAAHQVTLAGSD